MKSVRALMMIAVVALQGACKDDDPLKNNTAAGPPPPAQGIQTFVQVDNNNAQPGDHVQVYVLAQVGTESQAKIGSYTGRLHFDPTALAWVKDVEINDGLRVTNPGGAATGEIRFAGAAASGFNDLSLYHGEFMVKKTGYVGVLKTQIEELSAAHTLGNLQPQLRMVPQVFLRTAP